MPAPVRNVPTTVTVLPPASGPELGSTAPTEVWGAATEVEAMVTAGLVQARWTGKGTPSTVRVSVPLAAADTDAVPAALPAVKLSAGPLAVELGTGSRFGDRRRWDCQRGGLGGRRGPRGRDRRGVVPCDCVAAGRRGWPAG